jgi:hypothetical protein
MLAAAMNPTPISEATICNTKYRREASQAGHLFFDDLSPSFSPLGTVGERIQHVGLKTLENIIVPARKCPVQSYQRWYAGIALPCFQLL